ncbi:coenzyme Q9, putative [Acanthamoeba castellanii str. Neff]|uniref:Ubiquinone biosynthesis protein n=1 Tax=Acanthamoeba castellanii (strain ATCC 30010 / Neff) TaxID=1257118 RepID=L8H691_ACACF|nr:coenzyme Q9, putative [Acanthamoeba castellanii str. Neff]ELR21024.1 coenzyme Q9, putative [Acanthamoeba castellanii str. Neff]
MWRQGGASRSAYWRNAAKPLSVTDASAAVRIRGRGCVLRSSGRPFFARTTGLWRGLFTSAESHGEQYRQPEEEDAIFEDRDGGFSDAVRTQVAKYGWTVEALSLAAAEQGLSNLAHGLFRRGPVELVEHFIAKCNARMLEELSALDMEHMTLKEKIRAAIHARLRQYAPHIATWPQAIAILAQPSNASTSFSLMFNTINDIIYVAGDSTIDFDWYTKRAVLAGVYTSTELFMLTDASDNFADTWAFLNRRLEDVVTLSKYKAEVPSPLPRTTIPFLRELRKFFNKERKR